MSDEPVLPDFVFGPHQSQWLKELEFGQHEQCKGVLSNGTSYCCLGIARKFVLGLEIKEDQKVLTQQDKDDMGLNFSNGLHCHEHKSLAHMNDSGMPFKEIATVIRKDPRGYFGKSV